MRGGWRRVGAVSTVSRMHRLLMQIPGAGWVTTASIMAEIGTDMDVLANAHRLGRLGRGAPGN